MSKMAPMHPKDTKGGSGTQKDSHSGQSAPKTSFRAPWSPNKTREGSKGTQIGQKGPQRKPIKVQCTLNRRSDQSQKVQDSNHL